MAVSPDKEKAVESAMIQIERQFGKGAIMKLGSRPVIDVPVIPSGSLALDKALGIGGIPRGRVTEIFGPESSGKTTLALHIVAQAQKQNGIAAFIDAEHALDTVYARKLGVNCEELLVSQPDTGEQALEITEMLVRSGAIDVVVIDSVAALTPRCSHGASGKAHVSGIEKAYRNHRQDHDIGDFHQSDPHENRHGFRKSRNYHRRKCLEILRFGQT